MKWRRVPPMEGAPVTRSCEGRYRVVGNVSPISDHERGQQPTVKDPTMVSGDLHAVTMRLDLLRDIMIELVAALPPDRAACVVTAIGNRLTERLGDMQIDEPSDDAMVSGLVPLLAALRHPRAQRPST